MLCIVGSAVRLAIAKAIAYATVSVGEVVLSGIHAVVAIDTSLFIAGEPTVPVRGKAMVAEVASANTCTAVAVEVAPVPASVEVGEAGAAWPSVKAMYWPVVDVAEATVMVPIAMAEVVVATVVIEVAVIPIPTVESGAKVAETVVDPAIISNAGTPVAGVPEVAAIAIAPVAGCPERIDVGWFNPGAVHPLISIAGPGPIAGCPDVAVARNGWLNIDGYRRRSDSYRNEHTCVS